MSFTWIPFYKELSKKLLQFRYNRKPLVDWIYDNLQGYINHLKDDSQGTRVDDIDPFTTYAIFNRGITVEKRIIICQKFKEYLDISVSVPEDFDAIPVMNTQRTNFMAFKENRKDGDIERFWKLFEAAVNNEDIEQPYNALMNQFLVKYNITMGLFWIRPDKYLGLDSTNYRYLKSIGITYDNTKFLPYNEYDRVMTELKNKMQTGEIKESNFAEFSYNAWMQLSDVKDDTLDNKINKKKNKDSIAYWIYSPGTNAGFWEDYYNEGIMGIGWKEAGNLNSFHDKDSISKKLKDVFGNNSTHKQEALMLYNFAHTMKPGDIVFAKKGRSLIVGRGIVTSDYIYEESRGEQPNIRKIDWTHKGEWGSVNMHPMKTLTDITRYTDYITNLNALFKDPDENKRHKDIDNHIPERQYWFITANPRVWSLSEWPNGGLQEYSLYNDKGNKRRIFKNFLDANQGDPVICYETTPTKQIKCLAEVESKNDGKCLPIRLTKNLLNFIDFDEIKGLPELENMEYLKNQQGSFFKLTKEEYDTLMYQIDEANPEEDRQKEYSSYSDKDFLSEVYISQTRLNQIKHLLLRKQNVILQGAPGVGKTFCAKRLAYSLLGEVNDDRISFIQFHQNYSYEDFIMGYKPEGSDFVLKEGVFYRFCRKAQNDPQGKYFFIIDEINRGNLSKIFGELLMLIEKEYRGTYASMPYKEERFVVPQNLYIIGMMNTADRSLAMIDYALRRRFSFIEMEPGFDSDGFKNYQKGLKSELFDRIVNLIKELNLNISDDNSLGKGFKIGHSYLCGIEQKDCTKELLEEIVKYDILPMLQEYWFDNQDKVERWSKKFLSLFE